MNLNLNLFDTRPKQHYVTIAGMRLLALLAFFACFAPACDDIAVPEPEDMSILPGSDDMGDTD